MKVCKEHRKRCTQRKQCHTAQAVHEVARGARGGRAVPRRRVASADLVAVLEGEMHSEWTERECVIQSLDEVDVARGEEVRGQDPEEKRAVERGEQREAAGGGVAGAAGDQLIERLQSYTWGYTVTVVHLPRYTYGRDTLSDLRVATLVATLTATLEAPLQVGRPLVELTGAAPARRLA